MHDKPLIDAPRKLDRPQVLSHSRGLQSKGFSSQILESSGVRIQNAFFLSLRGSEATEAIHKKVDSSVRVDRHADKSARDDRKRNKSYHTTHAAGFLMRKQGCEAFCAEISLDGYRTSKRQAPCFIAKSQREKGK